MRKIIVLRGAQGAGKSTFVVEQQLDPYVISSDAIRLLFGSVRMSPQGNMTINHENEHKIWSFISELLDRKMAQGEFIVVDATFQKSNDFSSIIQKAKLYRYEIICIDFSDVPLQTALERNALRPEYKQVSNEIIALTHQKIINEKIPSKITVFSYAMFANQRLIDCIDVKKVDLSAYKKVHHIGDVQGCFQPLEHYFKDGFKQDEFYIFVGDFLDRGIQNAQVMQFLLNEVISLPNVVLLWGNHETHLHNFALDLKICSREFNLKTLSQLLKINFSKDQAETLCQKLVDCFVYEYAGFSCFVSHAGISKIPQHPVLLPSIQYWKGTGVYDHPVDELFSKNMKDSSWIQVHGHRNNNVLPIQAGKKSFNLEGQVEFGGHLRIMTLHENGSMEFLEIKNNVYASQQISDGTSLKCDADEFGKMSEHAIDSLTHHNFVRLKWFKSYPHICSYTFKPSVFSKKSWDDVVVKARGLFVDNNRTIVARSYNKFFNVNELPSLTLDTLSSKLKFPLSVYIKENGYLGILGYDQQTDDLFFASKSTPESEYAHYFKQILMQHIGEQRLPALKNYVRTYNVGLIFEVIDIVNDPHIIEYDTTKIILLDIIARTESFSCLSYKELEKLALQYGLAYKTRAMQFQDWPSFLGWYQSVQRAGKEYQFQGKHIEGFVVQDCEGFLFKIKLPYYGFWRQMRELRDQMAENRRSGKAIRADLTDQNACSFYTWLSKKPDEMLAKSIIELRKMYIEQTTF